MEKAIDMNEWFNGAKEVKSTIDLIELSDFTNFNMIRKGLHIRAPKITLLMNPTAYQNLFNEVEKAAKAEGIIMSFVEDTDSFTLAFK